MLETAENPTGSQMPHQAVYNSFGDGLLELRAHMGDVCRDMCGNHLQMLLTGISPLWDLCNSSPCVHAAVYISLGTSYYTGLSKAGISILTPHAS